jgi:hypothetical protein
MEDRSGVVSGQGAPQNVNPSGSSVLTGFTAGGDSSQMILNRPDDSQE